MKKTNKRNWNKQSRLVVILLCGALCVSILGGCGAKNNVSKQGTESPSPSESSTTSESVGTNQAETSGQETAEQETPEQKSYDKTISFIYTNSGSEDYAGQGDAYKEAVSFQTIEEMFNVKMERWDCPSSEKAEKQRTWINSGTMPDMMRWSSPNLAEYLEYVENELIRALPDDWAEGRPNLKTAVECAKMDDAYIVDGKRYIIPVTTFGCFYQPSGALTNHQSLYFRKDWAKQVGMENMGADGTVTLKELEDYLLKVKEAGLCSIPLGGGGDRLTHIFSRGLGICLSDIQETEDGFVYGPAQEEYKKVISTMQDWYQRGLLDAEYYTQKDENNYYDELFRNGMVAARYQGGGSGNIYLRFAQSFINAGLDPEEILGFAQIRGEDGQVYSYETKNYYGAMVFNPDTDDETIDRLLDIMDYFCTKEGALLRSYGVRDRDWEWETETQDSITILRDLKAEGLEANKVSAMGTIGIAGDDFQLSGLDKNYPPFCAEWSLKGYKIRETGVIFPVSRKAEAFTGESKKNYSVPISSKLHGLVCGGGDVDTEWDKFMAEYQAIWKPYIDDLNALYYGG